MEMCNEAKEGKDNDDKSSKKSGKSNKSYKSGSSEKSAEFFNVKKMITTENLKVYSTMQEFDLSSPLQDYKIKSPLIGDYQIENIASAVACVEILISKGYQIEKEAIERGVENVKWPARLQSFMVENQRILVDGAHNPFSAFRLIESIQQHFKFRKLLIQKHLCGRFMPATRWLQ